MYGKEYTTYCLCVTTSVYVCTLHVLISKRKAYECRRQVCYSLAIYYQILFTYKEALFYAWFYASGADIFLFYKHGRHVDQAVFQ